MNYVGVGQWRDGLLMALSLQLELQRGDTAGDGITGKLTEGARTSQSSLFQLVGLVVVAK